MAEAISLEDWLETLTYLGGDVSFDVEFLGMDAEGRAQLRTSFRAGNLTLWQGDNDVVAEGSGVSVGGFVLRNGDLILENFGDSI